MAELTPDNSSASENGPDYCGLPSIKRPMHLRPCRLHRTLRKVQSARESGDRRLLAGVQAVGSVPYGADSVSSGTSSAASFTSLPISLRSSGASLKGFSKSLHKIQPANESDSGGFTHLLWKEIQGNKEGFALAHAALDMAEQEASELRGRLDLLNESVTTSREGYEAITANNAALTAEVHQLRKDLANKEEQLIQRVLTGQLLEQEVRDLTKQLDVLRDQHCRLQEREAPYAPTLQQEKPVVESHSATLKEALAERVSTVSQETKELERLERLLQNAGALMEATSVQLESCQGVISTQADQCLHSASVVECTGGNPSRSDEGTLDDLHERLERVEAVNDELRLTGQDTIDQALAYHQRLKEQETEMREKIENACRQEKQVADASKSSKINSLKSKLTHKHRELEKKLETS